MRERSVWNTKRNLEKGIRIDFLSQLTLSDHFKKIIWAMASSSAYASSSRIPRQCLIYASHLDV